MKILTNKQYEKLLNETQRLYPPVSGDRYSGFLLGGDPPLTPIEAMKIGAVFRCVDLGSRTMASLPLHMFEKTADGKVRAERHRVYPLVYTLPNKYTTAYEFWQMYFANLMLTRGAFAKIVRNRQGYITALWNIPTANVSGVHVDKETGTHYIVVSDNDGNSETLLEGEYMYTPSFRLSSDNDPENPLVLAASVLGLTKEINSYADRGFSGAAPGGYIEYPGTLSDKAYERFKNDFLTNYSGVANAGKWMFLEQGSKATRWSVDMENTQLLESRKFAVTEVCRIFGIPPHLCFDLEHATFSNIEQQSLEFVRDFVNPMSVRVEQTLYKDLLTDKEKDRYFFKFNTSGLLRGDTAARTAYYASARQNGWMSANEIRELEDFNSLGDLGDVVYINGAMLPLDTAQYNAPKSAQNRLKGETNEKVLESNENR